MRKIIMTVLMALLSVALVGGVANAALSGQCASCHTMHNSQDGAAVDSSGPNNNLTKFSCIGCHSGGVAEAPNVTGEGATMTAGGTFKSSVVGSAPHKVHNVRDITWTVDETDLLNTTPGSVAGGFTEPAGATELTCATALGCHGQSAAGFKGFHHGTYPNSYRFLRVNDGAGGYTDVNGDGSSDWEKGGATTTNHNLYDADGTNSISSLCGMCHGGFHGSSDTNASSPFKRHPTDAEGVIANIDGASAPGWTPTSAEVNETPFGFTGAQIATMSNGDMTGYTSDLGKAICLSCHRAHGSSQNDLLRFDYSTMNAGNSTNNHGCETCHTAQR